MNLTRRHILSGSLALAGAAALPRRLMAQELRLGDLALTTLSDGNLVLPGSFILDGAPMAEASAILERYGLGTETLTPPCNVTLLRLPDRVVLFDTGAGSGFQPSAGRLPEALDALGVAPDEVTDVVFTHAHPDHIWGVLDDFDDPLFQEARHHIGRVEFDYWMDPATVDSIGAERASFAVGAQRRLEALAEVFDFFEDGAEVVPGVAAVMTPGHTPGHMSFELRSGGEGVLIGGDAIGNHHVAFEQPAWFSGSDQDQPLGAETRARLLARLADEQMTLIGFHLPEGGMGRVERAGGAYRFAPLAG